MNNHDKLLRFFLNQYRFDRNKYDSGVYDSLYFQVFDEEAALDVLEQLGFLYPSEPKVSRRSYYERYKNKKIGELPLGYRGALYFLIENGYAEAVL